MIKQYQCRIVPELIYSFHTVNNDITYIDMSRRDQGVRESAYSPELFQDHINKKILIPYDQPIPARKIKEYIHGM